MGTCCCGCYHPQITSKLLLLEMFKIKTPEMISPCARVALSEVTNVTSEVTDTEGT